MNITDDALNVKIVCLFENIYCPFAERGHGDRRKLSLALQSFTIETVPYDGSNTATAAALRRLLAQRPHRLTVAVVDDDFEAGIRLSRILETAGLGGLFLICGQSLESTLVESDLSSKVEDKQRESNQFEPLELATYNGTISQLLAGLPESQLRPDLIVLPDFAAFSELLDALSQSLRPRGGIAPDIIMFTRELDFWEGTYWLNPATYTELISPLTAVAWPDFVHLSRQRSMGVKSSYGTMVALIDDTEVRFSIEGISTPNARTGPTIALFRSILARAGAARRGKQCRLTIQYGDLANEEVGSVAYGRKRGASPAVRLIPDTYFFRSQGYRTIWDALSQGNLPRWEDRQPMVFWRGAATTNFTASDGSPVKTIEQVPRIAMCLALRDAPRTDAAIIGPWLLDRRFGLDRSDVITRLKQHHIFRPGLPMIKHADYRFLIDIDGVANAWSFFEKLLLGSCVLKVISPFEQWFYGDVTAWQHYVPIRQDLSDLAEKLEWSLQHEEDARSIAERGQWFAANHTYEAGLEIAITAVNELII